MTQAALHLTIAALICLLAGGAPPHILIAGLVLSLLPDIDTPKSLIGSLLPRVSSAIERRVGHRTATHSLTAAALPVAGLAYLLAPGWWGALTACYVSHIALDLLIGRQGVKLFWPAHNWLTIAGWADNGPAPRRLLLALVPLTLAVAIWPLLGPGLATPLGAAAAFANPIATSAPTRTPPPSVTLSFELPPGVGLSALAVREGDMVSEGQVLASWDAPALTPWPTATRPAPRPSPGPASPAEVLAPPPADTSALVAARADLAALRAEASAERTALRLPHEGELREAERARDAAELELQQLQPLHEREQAERQRAVELAAQGLAVAQAALAGADEAVRERAEGSVRQARADLDAALDAQSRMRTEQGVERERLQAALAHALADLDALPARQADERAALEARLAADLARAEGRVAAAESAVTDTAARAEDARQRGEATAVAAAAAEGAAAATAWAQQADREAEGWAAAVAATAAAAPTPWPTEVRGRAAGRVARITAEERGGRLVVTIELVER